MHEPGFLLAPRPVTWAYRLADARARGRFTEHDQKAAEHWGTGPAAEVVPRDDLQFLAMLPKRPDVELERLRTLELAFLQAVLANDVAGAEAVYAQIVPESARPPMPAEDVPPMLDDLEAGPVGDPCPLPADDDSAA
jgi:hypothetical protein